LSAVLELELIGDDCSLYPAATRPWVAQIVGAGRRYGLEREFLVPNQTDYSQANSIGSRGVHAYYVLPDGLYEVNRRLGWKRLDRYFIRVSGDTITRIDRAEVLRCLANAS
jgi:hypothetical protein